MAATGDGNGYWFVAPTRHLRLRGCRLSWVVGNVHLNAPIVAWRPTSPLVAMVGGSDGECSRGRPFLVRHDLMMRLSPCAWNSSRGIGAGMQHIDRVMVNRLDSVINPKRLALRSPPYIMGLTTECGGYHYMW